MTGIDTGRYALGILAALAGIGFGVITLYELVTAGPNTTLAGRAKAAREVPREMVFVVDDEYVAEGTYGYAGF